MANETVKCHDRRVEDGTFKKYLNGFGIDIGCGRDKLKLPKGIKGKVVGYDIVLDKRCDAQTMKGVKDNLFDFVYSSHCLEHLDDPYTAYRNWVRVCKPGGYIYVVVPDVVTYEKMQWPSKFAGKYHKHNFSYHAKINLDNNIWVHDLLRKVTGIDYVSVFKNTDGFDSTLPDTVDQTKRGACCQIEFITRKHVDGNHSYGNSCSEAVNRVGGAEN